MFHVEPGILIPLPAVEWLRANMPNLETHHIGPGVHYVQEDHPQEIGRVLAEWLTRV